MDPPGQAMPDCLIAARIANHMERVLREQGKNEVRRPLQGLRLEDRRRRLYGWLPQARERRRVRHLRRLRAMGTNGFQEPAVGIEIGPVAAGTSTGRPGEVAARTRNRRRARQGAGAKGWPTKRRARPCSALNASSARNGSMPTASSTPDGKAMFMETQWRGLQAQGKEAEKNKWPFLINNGRTNHVWQSAYLDQENEFVMDRWPYPVHRNEPAGHGGTQRQAQAIWSRSTTTTARPRRWSIRRRARSAKQTFMLFAYPTGVQGNVVSAGVNEFIIPNYKQTWAGIRKIADAPEAVRQLTFKSEEYTQQSK